MLLLKWGENMFNKEELKTLRFALDIAIDKLNEICKNNESSEIINYYQSQYKNMNILYRKLQIRIEHIEVCDNNE
jgi:hypothetical protein